MADILEDDDIGNFQEYDYSDFEDEVVEAEETTDEVVSETEEKETEEVVDEIEQEVEVDTSWLSSFNKHFNTSYETVDEVKAKMDASISSDDKIDSNASYDAKIADYEAKLNKVKELYSQIQDPKTFFANDVELKKNLLLKENPNINGEVAGKLFSMDLEAANPIDVLTLELLLTHKSMKGREAAAKALVLDKYGIESVDELDDLTEVQKDKINIAAEEAASTISKMRDSVVVPERSEIDELLKGIEAPKVEDFDMTPWSGNIDKVVELAKTFSVTEGTEVLYSEPIEASFFEEAKEVIETAIKQGKLEPTDENISIMADELKKAWMAEHGEEVVKRALKAQERKHKEAMHNAIHNDSDPDKASQRPKATKVNVNLSKTLGII